ncbi:MAG: DUF389 domain-containing protein [Bacteroidales bacterium]|nr:DUF389 domain-containing protein [Bacteroidales bacterium]
MSNLKNSIKEILTMSDQVDYSGASESIKKNIYFRGPNVYILACAIIIASIGLNVNSIPVIIGAMLISPVMGPILGFGFGLGIRDSRLVKDSLKNFAVMVSISIVASTLYFILSPLNLEKPTELLARTNPTIYDVLIALFGGFAGIFEISRKERGTVLSGVAIATALMPPLCTVGYGLSVMNWQYILGAMYLFVINSIFIALATYATVKYLQYPVVESVTDRRTQMTRTTASIVLILIIVPSVISAINIIRESNFKIHAHNIVEENRSIGQGFIYDYKIDNGVKPPVIELYMAGQRLDLKNKEKIYTSAERFGIGRSQICFHEDAARQHDVLSESQIVKGIYEHTDMQLQALNDTIASLKGRLDGYESKILPAEEIFRELQVQYPSIVALSLTRGSKVSKDNSSEEDCIAAMIDSATSLDEETVGRIRSWLSVRLNSDPVVVVVSVVKHN